MGLAAATRRHLIRSMRACTASRLPFSVKYLYIRTLSQALPATKEATKSEYGTRFLPGTNLNMLLEYRGVYEPVLSEFIRHHIRPGDVCVDAGANVGYFSLLLAQQVGPRGKVIAIEAAPSTVERLRANIALNNADVTVVEAAVTSQKGEVIFHLYPYHDAWNRITPPVEGDPDRRLMSQEKWIPVTVKGDTAPEIVGKDIERVSFIKVDIEGAESAVTPDIAAFPHPDLVVALEAKSPNIAATLKPFEARGFYVYDLHNDYRWLYERRLPAITQTTYRALSGRSMVDVLVSRQLLAV
jgi:FkbM family methyltransferase